MAKSALTKVDTVTSELLNDLKPTHDLQRAMVAAYAELEVVGRTIEGQAGNRKYKYAGLAAIYQTVRPTLAKFGIAVFQPAIQERDPETGQLFVGCRTEILHASGESRIDRFLIVCPNETPQAMGSAITYARRYSYPFAVVDDEHDDDGAAAQPEGGQNRPDRRPGPAGPSGPANAPAASSAISAAQVKRFMAILNNVSGRDDGLNQEIVAQAKAKVGYSANASIKTLPKGLYDGIIEFIEAWPPMEVPEETDEQEPAPDQEPEWFDQEAGF